MARPMVALNEHGRRIGETHHRAKLSDALVNHLRDLHEHQGLGWRKLAALFTELSPITIKKLIAYERRAQSASSWRPAVSAASSAEDRRHV